MPSAERSLTPQSHIALARFSTLGVGGLARWFVDATAMEDVEQAHRWALERALPVFILGGGSNIVVADEGIEGLVLHMRITGASFHRDGAATIVSAGAGGAWDAVVAAAVRRGLAGLECLSGIPGSVGGTPIQNVGAYGQEVADTLVGVAAFDREKGSAVSLSPDECRFAYRTSRFKHADAGRFVVCQVSFRLRTGTPTTTYPDVLKYLRDHDVTQPTIADVRAAVLAIRRGKGMVIDASDADTRSVGSFFTNPVVPASTYERLQTDAGEEAVPGYLLASGEVKVPAAWMIERSGFRRGFHDGAAGLSSKHPLAIINRGGATARDVLRLATRIKRQVADRFGIALRPEPVFVGFTGDPDVDYLLGSESNRTDLGRTHQ